MKLLITTPIFPPEIGGPATYVYELCRRWKGNHDIAVITFGETVKPLSGISMTVIPLRYRWLGSVQRQSRLLWKRLVIKFVGDLTWENAFGQGNTQKFLDEFLEHPDTGWITRLKIKIQKAVFHAADRVVVPSQYLKNVLRTHYALPENKIKVIYNAIELEKLPFKPKSAAHRISLLTIGRLVKWKHVDQIIQALHGLSSEQFHLNIIGEGPEKIHLQRKVKEWDLERKVTFHGSLPHE